MELCKIYNNKECNTAYHPAGNGLVERTNRKVMEVMRLVMEPTGYTWEESLSYVQCAIDSALNSSVRDSPHFYSILRKLGYRMSRVLNQNLCMT